MKIQRICCKAFYSKFKYCCRILLILISLVSDRLTSCKSTHAEWNSFLFNFESETRSLSNIRKSIKVWQHIDYMNYSYWYLMNKRILIENEAKWMKYSNYLHRLFLHVYTAPIDAACIFSSSAYIASFIDFNLSLLIRGAQNELLL